MSSGDEQRVERELDWVDIPGYSNYQITREGYIRSNFKNKGRVILNPYCNPYGYLTVNLYKNGKLYNYRVHRLVLTTFVGECPHGMVACHRDGNKLNNNISNLEWGTQQSNYWDARRHGTASILERHGSAKLNQAKAAEIRAKLANGQTKTAIGREYGVDRKAIYLIAKGKTWKTN